MVYDPHIDPALQFDVGRAQIEKIIDDALTGDDEEDMRLALQQLQRLSERYLNWAGKAERTSFEVDTVSLHVHERIDPASIALSIDRIRAAHPRLRNGAKSRAHRAGFRRGIPHRKHAQHADLVHN